MNGSAELLHRDSQDILAYLDKFPEPTPEFDYRLAWSNDYDELLASVHVQLTPAAEATERVWRGARIILAARGGGAKSVLLRRIARSLVRANALVSFVDLKRWVAKDYAQWTSLDTTSGRVRYLLSEVAVGADLAEITGSAPSARRVIIVDGLNEVTYAVGQDILEAIDDLLTFAVSTGVIVADRLVRRTINRASRWSLGTIAPLEAKEIERHLNAIPGISGGREHDELLATPFFLDQALKGHTGRTEADTLLQYFTTVLNREGLRLASMAAYRAYERYMSRTFSLRFFAEVAGNATTERLREAGDLTVTDQTDTAYFSHHLKHDFLAAAHFKDEQDAWEGHGFDVLSLKASSFDALTLALQQLQNSHDADEFVTRAYDWNLYGAAYAVTEASEAGPSATPVSAEMQFVILAMLAVRRWDVIESTRTKALDALRLFPSTTGAPFLAAPDRAAVIDIVNSFKSDADWFNSWRRLLSTPELSAGDDPAEAITDENSINGWTLANVLKNLDLSKDVQQRLLRSLQVASRSVVRWRIVHAIGGFPSERNVRGLFRWLDRETESWVRYGTVRSLVEMAARTSASSLRKKIFSEFTKRAESMITDSQTVAEFEAALFVAQECAPSDWIESVRGTLESLYEHETTAERREHWLNVGLLLQRKYARQ
jgi:hypothetical protein